MTTGSMTTMKKNYENTLCLRNLVYDISNALDMCKESNEVTQETLDVFKKQLTKIQQESPNGFLIIEIIELTSWLSNISNITEALEVCKERMNYLDDLIACFAFKKSCSGNCGGHCNGNCKCGNHGAQ